MIDTGSTASLIRKSVLKTLKQNPEKINTKIKLGNQKAEKISEVIYTDVTIESEDKIAIVPKQKLLIYDKMSHDIILGIDFCHNVNLQMIFENGNCHVDFQTYTPISTEAGLDFNQWQHLKGKIFNRKPIRLRSNDIIQFYASYKGPIISGRLIPKPNITNKYGLKVLSQEFDSTNPTVVLQNGNKSQIIPANTTLGYIIPNGPEDEELLFTGVLTVNNKRSQSPSYNWPKLYTQEPVQLSTESISKIKINFKDNETNGTLHANEKLFKDHKMELQSVNFDTQNPYIYVKSNGENQIIPAETLIAYIEPEDEEIEVLLNIDGDDKTHDIDITSKSKTKEPNEEYFNIGDISKDQKRVVKEFLKRHQKIFADDMTQLTVAKGVEHTIDVGTSKPIHLPPYRTSPKEKEIIRDQIKEMLAHGIIRKGTGPWSFPVCLVMKKNGQIRFCIDYRKLNEITVKNAYPLPRIDDILDAMNGCLYFSSLDMFSGYWQLPILESDKVKTGFITSEGLYEWNCLPFGLCNAPSVFQEYMNKVLGGILWIYTLVYLDDISVFSRTFEDHLKHLEEIFRRINKYNLRLNPKKCKFASPEIKFLGHIVKRDGISPDPDKINSIKEFPQLKTIRDIRSFIGLTSYYRKFIRDFSMHSKPLTELLKKDNKFVWSTECETAYQFLKNCLMTDPILAHFKPGEPLILYTDASLSGLGAILSQIQNGAERVISYASIQLNRSQRNYSVTELEMLAIIWSTTKFRPYLYGTHFTIKSDHHSLCFLMSLRDPNSRLARWALRMSEYQFTIEYKSGKKHLNVDCLSRYPVEEPQDVEEMPLLLMQEQEQEQEQEEDEVQDFEINIQEMQSRDRWCIRITKMLTENNENYTTKYVIEDNRLFRKVFNDNRKEIKLLCVPAELRKDILHTMHADIVSGHLGFIKTWLKVRERFYWPQVENTVRRYVQQCSTCQRRKAEPGRKKGLLQSIPTGLPMDMCAMDFLGPLRVSKNGKRWIIVFVDYASRYLITQSLVDSTAESVAQFFVYDVVLKYGAVKKVVTDKGRQFISNFLKAVMDLFSTIHIKSSGYHPQTTGLAEKSVGNVTNMIAMYVNSNQDNWDTTLSFITFAYNSAVQRTTKMAPFMTMFGRPPVLPVDVVMNLPSQPYPLDIAERFVDAWTLVRERIKDSQFGQTVQYNKFRRDVEFKPGDKVLVYTPVRKVGMTEKFLLRYFGPYEVIKKTSNVNYLLKDLRSPH